MSDYAEIANLSWDNIQEPKVLPLGSYLLKLKNVSFQPSKDQDKSPVVLFIHQPKEPMDDVKTEELEALGKDYDISENKTFTRIYIEDGSSWDQVRKLLAKHGVDVSGSVPDSFKKAKGTEVIGFLETRNFQRQDGTQGEANNVTSFSSVE